MAKIKYAYNEEEEEKTAKVNWKIPLKYLPSTLLKYAMLLGE